jgi:hypothetical protein
MIDESKHDMIQRIAKLYDVPMNLIDYGEDNEPVSRVDYMDVRISDELIQPGALD